VLRTGIKEYKVRGNESRRRGGAISPESRNQDHKGTQEDPKVAEL